MTQYTRKAVRRDKRLSIALLLFATSAGSYFNSKPWADRSLKNHLKTWGVRNASSLFCDSCKPFNITFGVYTELP